MSNFKIKKMKTKILLGLLLLLLLGGCVPQMQICHGKMYSLKDGTELKLDAEFSQANGAMTAYNPVTDEHFTGNYSGVSQTTDTQSHNFWGSSNTVTTNSNQASVKGILKGDKGTIITIDALVNMADTPDQVHGYGTGVDNNGIKYQIQF